MKHFRTDPATGESAAYAWSSALDDDVPTWRAGRAHAVIARFGLRRNRGNGGRRDLHLNVEWGVVPKHRFGIGFEVKVGCPGSERDLALSIFLGPLLNLWLSTEGLLPERLLAKGYESRVTGARVAHDHVEWQVWHPRNSWTRGTPWWRYSYHRWEHLLFGSADLTKTTVDQGTTVVPMPERTYDATYEVVRIERRWPRRLGRLRPRQVNYSTHLTPLDPIPVPGKGENSWDCGDDAIHGQTSPGRSVEAAVGHLVASALATRRRHGGDHMSIPPAAGAAQ